MHPDIARFLGVVERTSEPLVRDGKPACSVTVACSFEAITEEQLWEALTEAKLIERWFVPVSGRLELGGSFQFENQAGGKITHCERHSFFAVTWEYMEDLSWVEVRVSDGGDQGARLALTHISLLGDHWFAYGPGATGVGWELGLLGLDHYFLQSTDIDLTGETFHQTREGKEFIEGSSDAWRKVSETRGFDPEQARIAARRTADFYLGVSDGKGSDA